ncbi:MAG: hypothetical protein IJ141_02000 [Lachnospiraceae bacterium]|nr:hypothetical protein [Lachnospiraceae bacterium]
MKMLKCPSCNSIMVEGIKKCPICNTDSLFFKEMNDKDIPNNSFTDNTFKTNTYNEHSNTSNEKKSFNKEKNTDLIKEGKNKIGSILSTVFGIFITIVILSMLFGNPNNKINKTIDDFASGQGFGGSDNGSIETSIIEDDEGYELYKDPDGNYRRKKDFTLHYNGQTYTYDECYLGDDGNYYPKEEKNKD